MDAPESQAIERASRARPLLVGGLLAMVTIVVLAVLFLRTALNRVLPASPTRMALVLEKIAEDQETFKAGDQEGDGVNDYGTVAELVEAQLMISAFEDGETLGYRFELQVSASQPTEKWMAVANPVSQADRGQPVPAFVINHERVLHTVPGTANLDPDCALPADATRYQP